MKLADGFITHDADRQQLLIATGRAKFKGLVRSNETAAFIIECLKQDITADEIKTKVFEHFDASKEEISDDVDEVLKQLRNIGAIKE